MPRNRCGVFIKLPEDVKFILETLKDNQKEAYVVGGCVRDSLLKRDINDWDITTSATPAEVIQIFQVPQVQNILLTGLQHGTVTVMINDIGYEVTTYRIDGEYEDNRRPSSVEFTTDLAKDLSRRDFTINAMAYNPWTGLVDLFDGRQDMKDKRIRCVCNAKERFSEDALRILRAIRFASQLGFVATPDVSYEIYRQKGRLANISVERIWWEFKKIVASDDCVVQLILYRDVFAVFIPELKPMFDFDQKNPWHIYDVYQHTAKAMEYCNSTDINVRLAVLFHDIGKPQCYTEDENGVGHFHGHGEVSYKMVNKIFTRLKVDNKTRENVAELVYHHDATIEPNERNVKRWLCRIGEEQLWRLFEVRMADIKAQNPDFIADRLDKVLKTTIVLNDILQKKQCFSLRDLAVNGNDLIELGFTPGVYLGQTLHELLDAVIDWGYPNDRQKLLERALCYLRNYNKHEDESESEDKHFCEDENNGMCQKSGGICDWRCE